MAISNSQRFLAGIGILLLVVTLILVGLDQLVARTDLTIKEIRYKGEFERVNLAAVEKVVLDNIDEQLFSTDIHELEDLIVYLPWVKKAHISREWPDALEIIIEELKPIARINEYKILVNSGELYDNPHDDKDVGLIEVTIDESMFEPQKEMIFNVISLAKELPFEVYQVVISSRGSLTMMLGYEGQDLEVIIGSRGVEERLARFATIWKGELKNNLNVINKVDMRYQNGFVVKMREERLDQG